MPLSNFGLVGTVSGKRIYRGAQPDSRGFEDLKALGITHIIKLNPGDGDQYAATLGIQVCSLRAHALRPIGTHDH